MPSVCWLKVCSTTQEIRLSFPDHTVVVGERMAAGVFAHFVNGEKLAAFRCSFFFFLSWALHCVLVWVKDVVVGSCCQDPGGKKKSTWRILAYGLCSAKEA